MVEDLAEERFRQAMILRENGEFAAARDALVDLTVVRPHSAGVFTVLGKTYWDLREMDRAIESFRTATTLAPKSELSSLGLFHCLWDLGRRKEALVEMRRFLSVGDSKDYKEIQAELRQTTRVDR